MTYGGGRWVRLQDHVEDDEECDWATWATVTIDIYGDRKSLHDNLMAIRNAAKALEEDLGLDMHFSFDLHHAPSWSRDRNQRS